MNIISEDSPLPSTPPPRSLPVPPSSRLTSTLSMTELLSRQNSMEFKKIGEMDLKESEGESSKTPNQLASQRRSQRDSKAKKAKYVLRDS